MPIPPSAHAARAVGHEYLPVQVGHGLGRPDLLATHRIGDAKGDAQQAAAAEHGHGSAPQVAFDAGKDALGGGLPRVLQPHAPQRQAGGGEPGEARLDSSAEPELHGKGAQRVVQWPTRPLHRIELQVEAAAAWIVDHCQAANAPRATLSCRLTGFHGIFLTTGHQARLGAG